MREARRSRKILRATAIGVAALALILAPHAAPRIGPGGAGTPAPGLPAAPPVTAPASRAEAAIRVSERLGSLPLRFEANRGQARPGADFIARGRGSAVTISKEGADIALGRCGSAEAVRLRLAGASAVPEASGVNERPGKVHYVSGDRASWITGVPTYAEVAYREVYPSTDLVWHGREGALEFDFVLAPGADPGAIALRYEGAKSVSVDAAGDLVIETGAGGEIRQHRPVAYQETPSGAREELPAGYSVAAGGLVAFAVGPYDPARRLTIDPFLSYSTLFGEGGNEEARGIAVDKFGRAHVVGRCNCGSRIDTNIEFNALFEDDSNPFPGGGFDAFLYRLNAEGTEFDYVLNIQGSGQDFANGVAVDADGGLAYVTGSTTSIDFPVANTLGAAAGPGGAEDAFVMVVDDVGTPIYSSTFGSEGQDAGNGIAVDAGGAMYIVGHAQEGFPLATGTFDPDTGEVQAFVMKLKRGPGRLERLYSHVFGSPADDFGIGIALGNCDPAVPPVAGCDAFVTGVIGGGVAFAARLNRAGDGFAYPPVPLFSGVGLGIAVDSGDNAYVTGHGSEMLVGQGNCSFQPSVAGEEDAFVAKLDPSGGVVYATFLGGPDAAEGFDSPRTVGVSIAVDGRGRAILTGFTNSPSFPTRRAFQERLAGSSDAFVTAFEPDGCSLSYSTFLGGTDTLSADCRSVVFDLVGFVEAPNTLVSDPEIRIAPEEIGFGIAVDAQGSAYVAGRTPSVKFPTTDGSAQPDFGGSCLDAFTVKIEEIADLEIEKIAFPNPVTAGEQLTYTLKVTNHGPSGANDIVITESVEVPAIVTINTPDGPRNVLVFRNVLQTLPIGDIEVGESTSQDFPVQVDPRKRGLVLNTASVKGIEREPIPNEHPNIATAETTVQAIADLSLEKLGPEGPAVAGAETSFTFTFTNNGPSSATGLRLVDFLPPGFTFVRASHECGGAPALDAEPGLEEDGTMVCSVDAEGVLTCDFVGLELLPFVSCGATIVLRTDPALPDGSLPPPPLRPVRNTALIGGAELEPTVLDNGDFADVLVIRRADLSVTKTADLESVVAGKSLTYTITVRNDGPSIATGVRLTDVLPAGTSLDTDGPLPPPCSTFLNPLGETELRCTLPTLLPGQELPFAFTVKVDASQVEPLVNRAFVGATEPEPDGEDGDNSDEVVTPVEREARLTIVKTADQDPAVAGTVVRYRVEVGNEGPSSARGISIRDELPGLTIFEPGLSSPGCIEEEPGVIRCDFGDALPEGLRPGQLASVTIAALVASSRDSTDRLRNTVQASHAGPGESRIFTDFFVLSTDVVRRSDLVVKKTDNEDEVGDIFAGQQVVYRVTVTNNGPSDARDVVLTDTLPPEVDFVSSSSSTELVGQNHQDGTVSFGIGEFVAGASIEVTIVGHVFSGAPPSAQNVAEVTLFEDETAQDPNHANNVAKETTEFPRMVAIDVVTDAPGAVVAGADFRYTITVSNDGPSQADGVILRETLDAKVSFAGSDCFAGPVGPFPGAFECEIGRLPPDVSEVRTIDVHVPPDASGTLHNIVEVKRDAAIEGDLGDDASILDTPIVRRADLAVESADVQASVTAGKEVTYQVRVTNRGPSSAKGVVLTNLLPEDVEFVSSDSAPRSVGTRREGGTVTFEIGDLSVEESVELTVVGRVRPDAGPSGENVAHVALGELGATDPDESNDEAREATLFPRVVALHVETSAPQVFSGEGFTYTITVTNDGPSTAPGVSLRETLDAKVTFAGGDCVSPVDPFPNVFACSIGDLAPGASEVRTIAVNVPFDASGTIRSIAEVERGPAEEENLEDNTSVLNREAIRSADLSVTMTDEQDPVNAGTDVVYRITVKNNGPSSARDVLLTDTLPSDVEFVSSASSTPLVGSNHEGGVVTFGIGDLAPGGEAIELTIVGRVLPGAAPSGVNVARITLDTRDASDPDGTNDEATETTEFLRRVQLRVEKSAPEAAVAGEELTYTVAVVNDGPSTAAGVLLRDSLDAAVSLVEGECFALLDPFGDVLECEVGDLEPDTTLFRTITVRVSPGASDSLRNVVEIMCSDPATEGEEGLEDNVFLLETVVIRRADIELETTDAPVSVTAGTRFTLSHIVRNNGPSDAGGVEVAGALPPGTRFVSASLPSLASETSVVITIGDLAAGEEVSVTVTVEVDRDAPDLLASEAVASADEDDPDLTNNVTAGETEVTGAGRGGGRSRRNVQGGACAAAGPGAGDAWAGLPIAALLLLLATARGRGRRARLEAD